MEISPEVQAKIERVTKLPAAARAGILVAVGLMIASSYFYFVYQHRAEEVHFREEL